MKNILQPFMSGKYIWRFGLFLLVALSIYLLQVPISQDPGVYTTFFTAMHEFRLGNSLYGDYGYNLYKYSPAFALLTLLPMSYLPEIPGAVMWQFFSLAAYFFALLIFLPLLKMKEKATIWFSLSFIFYLLSDLVINGVHGQSNALLAGGIVLAVALYLRGQFIAAALVLAFFTNMKILPLALTLLLFLDLNKRFILSSILAHIFLWFLPLLVWGSEIYNSLYSDWWQALLIDKEISFGAYIHFYIGLRPFLEVNFGWIWGGSYFLFVLANAAIVGALALKCRLSGRFSHIEILMLINISLLFMLVFSTRTEGPTLALMGPVYLISLWWSFNYLNGRQRQIALWFLFFIFMLVSQSTSDLFRGTIIHELSWNYNLRFIGIAMIYLVHLVLFYHLGRGKKILIS